MSTKVFELPLGSWFRYEGQKTGAFILLDRGDCGLVAEAPTPELQRQSWSGQGIYSAAESRKEFCEMQVEFVPVRPQ